MKKKIIIDGQETNYSVTDDARIFNDKTGKELKGTYSTNEYHSVQLVINGKPKTFMFHRLVAQAFCENPNNYTIVDHIDRNKHNDCASNLRWVSSSENALNVTKKEPRQAKYYQGDFTEQQWEVVYNNANYMVSENGEFVKLENCRIPVLQERNGYLRVVLNGQYKSVHVVVWESFNHQIVPEGQYIDHIDGNRSNNHISNLRLVNQSENMKNSYVNGHSGAVKIYQFNDDGEFIASYDTIREASVAVQGSESAIRQAAMRHGKSAGYYWLREDEKDQIQSIIDSWIPPGFIKIEKFPTYCINPETKEIYNKRNKKLTPTYYLADGKTLCVCLHDKKLHVDSLLP